MEVPSKQPTTTMETPPTTTTTTTTSSNVPPVVVTPTKDVTQKIYGTDDASIIIANEELRIIIPNEELMPNCSIVSETMVNHDGRDGDDDDEGEELDPTKSRATSASSSPVTVSMNPIVENVAAITTKKRPAAVSNNGNTRSSNHQSNVSTPLSSSAKRNNVSTTTPSPSAVAKNWKQASMVHAELAALKQRGLAKLLNQHFTSTAQQLTVEKAAADAAILDLQERKARTKEFTPTNSSEISPLDQACIQANKWRAECRRKERETLLLYQQYVHKFGPTTILPVPTVPTTAHETTKGGVDGTKKSKLVVVPTGPMVLPPQPPSSRPVPTLVPNMTAQIEQTLEEYCARGGVAHPSIMTHGAEQTYSSIAVKEEFVFREYYRKQLEAKGVDAVCSPGYFKGNGTDSDVFAGNTVDDEIIASKNDKRQDEWNNEDVCSIVSGLTTLHSAMTREFIYDCENSVQTFLRDEQATVRKMMEEEDGPDYDASSSGDTHVSNVLIVQDSDATAKAAENMVQQMQDILQEYQKKHVGTTTNDKGTADAPTVEKVYPIAYPTNRTTEKWMIYYDEFYRQEYYHEVHTNRTQWDPPGSGMNNSNGPDSSFSNSHSTDVYSVVNGSGSLYDDLGLSSYDDSDRMERIIESNNHRVAAYRKRQRRKRRRRRLIVTILIMATMLLVCGGTYYHTCTSRSGDPDKPLVCTTIDNSAMTQWNHVITMFSYMNERSVREIPPKPDQCLLQLVDELDILYRMQQMSLQEREMVVEVMRRPWGCNIPLAYLFHSKCRRMASTQPIFDLQALINSMLQ